MSEISLESRNFRGLNSLTPDVVSRSNFSSNIIIIYASNI